MTETASLAGDIASTLQSASILHHPDPHHDLNPPTTASPTPPTPSTPAQHPLPRRQTLPPLPDLRFEQSYLRSIRHCRSRAGVAWVTLRDHVLLALFQGFVWTLLLAGWRYGNRASKLSGAGVGARLRRWWWGVNGWAVREAVR